MIHAETAFEIAEKMKPIIAEEHAKRCLKRSKKKLKVLIKFINKRIKSLMYEGETSFHVARNEGYEIPYLDEDEVAKLNSYYTKLGYDSYFGSSGEMINIRWEIKNEKRF